MKQALATLLEAFQFANDVKSDPWDFAVPIRSLRKLGLSEAGLRWLVQKNYVHHAREVTVHGDDGRDFRPTGNLTFVRRTCFVLTRAGAARACSISAAPASPPSPLSSGDNGQPLPHVIQWDAETRRLSVNGQVAKRFRWPAANQEVVLSAFQEEGWPERIDDPLPPQPKQDSKRRLADTIKGLNQKQSCDLIRFHGDGTGEGVVWELPERTQPPPNEREQQ